MSWAPKRSHAQCEAILTGPGMAHEIETRVIHGQVQRVYKNLPPSLRLFWLWATNEFKENTYFVLGSQRITYKTAFEQSVKLASVFESKYGIQKGDRVAICARNVPEYMVTFWACHLLGAITVLVNAWLPSEPLVHCITHTGSKLVLVDHERVPRVFSAIKQLRAKGVKNLIVLNAPDNTKDLQELELWKDVLDSPTPDPQTMLQRDPGITPEDSATIIFTSGTTGLPKGVLSTHRQFLTNLRNSTAAGARAALRRGEEIVPAPTDPQRGLLLSVPFFHVTGLTSMTLLATASGMKVVLMRKWDQAEAVRLIKTENIKVAGGVPSMVSDLVSSDLGEDALDSLLFGGAAAPEQLPNKAKAVFPKAALGQGYGMTETNSVVTGISGGDYDTRPTSIGLPCPVNDCIIVKDGVVQPPGTSGELWIRGPNVMQYYWGDKAATAKALTTDGWLKTGDLAEIDAEGFVYLRDRIKDIIIRGGENIASVTVENALYYDDRIAQAAAVGIPHPKLGEVVAAVVSTKPAHRGAVKEAELIALARSKLPQFAVPVMIVIQEEPFELTPSGKIVKAPLRVLAQQEWERRQQHSTRANAKL